MMQELTARQTVVLVAGLLCDEEIWSDVRRHLDTVADVQCFSLPGFSSIEAMAEHVLNTAPTRFALAGHSMGGRVALEVVRRDSSRVAGLALLNTGVHPPAPHESESRGRLVDLARTRGMTALAAEWLPPMLGPKRPSDDPLILRMTRMVERSSPDSFAAQIQALLHRPDARDVLPGLTTPTLLLSATEDRWSPPAQHAAMQELCPGAELVIVPCAGHMSPMEQPQRVAFELMRWLARVNEADAADLSVTERMAIQSECVQSIHRYARLTDLAAWDAVAAMFASDGILRRPSDPGTPIRGRDNILAAFKARPPRVTRHIVTNIEVTAESGTRAHAISTIVLYASETLEGRLPIESTAVGTFHDHFIKVGDEWLFAERRGSITMHSSTSTR